jgi:hypothetical protein
MLFGLASEATVGASQAVEKAVGLSRSFGVLPGFCGGAMKMAAADF